MIQISSVVTPERFDHALSYADYLAAIAVNRDQFEHYYDIARLTDDDVAFFKRAAARPSGPAKILVIAEAWCPDVFRGVPVFARIAEASDMTMKIVLRDENPDIMDEFLLNGKARAIPVARVSCRLCWAATRQRTSARRSTVKASRFARDTTARSPSCGASASTPPSARRWPSTTRARMSTPWSVR
jgi:Thioredoxin